MHARLDELLSLRDGEPIAAGTRVHVEGCTLCAATLATTETLRARLRALPPAPPEASADGWAAVQARLAARRERSRRQAWIAPLTAAASVVALGLFATLRWAQPGVPPAVTSTSSIVIAGDELADLRARSQALEALLAALPERPSVQRAGTALPIETLEAQVQWLDHQLSLAGADGDAPQVARLWRDRVEVMNSLVQLRSVEAQRVVL